jgi:uncharacterized membrane protein
VSRTAPAFMYEQFEILFRSGLLFIVIFALTAVVLAVARKVRGRTDDDARDAHEIMANFREVYDRGGLSDEEFRTIKAKLASEVVKGDSKDNASAL